MTTLLRENVPLAELSTLEVGGPARWLASCVNEAEVVDAVRWARERGVAIFVLGGGSNIVAADAGFDGLVLRVEDRGADWQQLPDHGVLRVGGGVVWDDLVALSVEEGLGGLEGLSGIPGWCGAAPIQNIGAYGQEVAETLCSVRAVDRRSGEVVSFNSNECGFGYRQSHFKGQWKDRFVVTRVDFELPRRSTGKVRYGELRRILEMKSEGAAASLSTIREAVLELRRGKSMVLDAADVNRRSAGSFFLNPVVSESQAEAVAQKARLGGIERSLPRFPADGGVKLPAAWLIEEAGFRKGHGVGAAGLSSHHCLALVNRGGASAREILALASEVRRGVFEAFGIKLQPEPVFVGFEESVEQLLA